MPNNNTFPAQKRREKNDCELTGYDALRLYRNAINPGVTYLPLCWPGVLGSDSLVLASLLVAADKKDQRSTFKTSRTLAAIAGVSKATVDRSLKRLREARVPNPRGDFVAMVLNEPTPRERGWLLDIENSKGRKSLKRLVKTRSDLIKLAKTDGQLLMLPIFARSLPWTQAFIYSYVVLRCGIAEHVATSECRRSGNGIARELGMDRRNAHAALGELHNKRLIRISEEKITLLVPPSWSISEDIQPCENESGRRKNESGTGVDLSHVPCEFDSLTKTETKTAQKSLTRTVDLEQVEVATDSRLEEEEVQSRCAKITFSPEPFDPEDYDPDDYEL